MSDREQSPLSLTLYFDNSGGCGGCKPQAEKSSEMLRQSGFVVESVVNRNDDPKAWFEGAVLLLEHLSIKTFRGVALPVRQFVLNSQSEFVAFANASGNRVAMPVPTFIEYMQLSEQFE